MPEHSFNLVFCLTPCVTAAVIVLLWRRPWVGLVAGALFVIGGMVAMFCAVDADINATYREFDARVARGETLSDREQMYDGVGDHVFVLFVGWMPGTFGLVLGGGLACALRRLSGCRELARPSMMNTPFPGTRRAV